MKRWRVWFEDADGKEVGARHERRFFFRRFAFKYANGMTEYPRIYSTHLSRLDGTHHTSWSITPPQEFLEYMQYQAREVVRYER